MISDIRTIMIKLLYAILRRIRSGITRLGLIFSPSTRAVFVNAGISRTAGNKACIFRLSQGEENGHSRELSRYIEKQRVYGSLHYDSRICAEKNL